MIRASGGLCGAGRRHAALIARDARDHNPRAFVRTKENVVQWRDGHPFFWCAEEGQGFRVNDVALVNGHVRKVAYESRRATHRVFVAVVGRQWRCAFGENDLHSITADELARQRAVAKFYAAKDQDGSNGGACS